MSLIVFAATEIEIAPFRDWLSKAGTLSVECIVTGPGILSSCYCITTTLTQKRPAWAVQAGIAGTLSDRFIPGDTVMVQDEIVGDSGVMESGVFIDAFDLGLMEHHRFPFADKKLPNPFLNRWTHLNLPLAHGVTVNQITTDITVMGRYRNHYGVEVESMEGASLHYAASMLEVPFIQIRSISNKVGERDKSKWKINEAVAALNETLIKMSKTL